jgi:methionyl aminopeptidase
MSLFIHRCCKCSKLLHKAAQAYLAQASAAAGKSVKAGQTFDGFKFTGKLRPAEVSPRLPVKEGIRKPDYAVTGVPVSETAKGAEIIVVHKPDEVEAMRRACAIGREVLDIASAAVRPGVTGDEIDKIVHAACMERNVYPSPLNYRGFPKSLCM